MNKLTRAALFAASVMVSSGLVAGTALAQAAKPMNPCAPKAANPCAAKPANPCAPKAMNPCAPKAANPCAAKKP